MWRLLFFSSSSSSRQQIGFRRTCKRFHPHFDSGGLVFQDELCESRLWEVPTPSLLHNAKETKRSWKTALIPRPSNMYCDINTPLPQMTVIYIVYMKLYYPIFYWIYALWHYDFLHLNAKCILYPQVLPFRINRRQFYPHKVINSTKHCRLYGLVPCHTCKSYLFLCWHDFCSHKSWILCILQMWMKQTTNLTTRLVQC